MSINKLFIILIFPVTFLTGCMTAPKQDNSMASIQAQTQDIVLHFNFPKKDIISGKAIEINLSKLDFSGKMSRLSQYRKLGYVDSLSYKGIKISKLSNKYIISYENGKFYPSARRYYHTDVTFDIPFTVSANKIQFSFPETYTLKKGNAFMGRPHKTLDKITALEADVHKIFNGISAMQKNSFKQSYILSGEINSNYPDSSIYANFKRKLGTRRWLKDEIKNYDLTKSKIFPLSYSNLTFPLAVSVFPYRNGSKVTYSGEIKYHYNSDGKFDIEPKTIEELESKIRRIIED